MMKLEKFYDLLHKCAPVKLLDGVTGKTFFEGEVKNIPDEYDAFTVYDFHMNNDGVTTFDIEKAD